MTTYIVTICLVASIAFLLGAMFASRGDQPIKRTIEQMNDAEALRAEHRKLCDAKLNLRAALIDIRNQGIASKSGTARSMALKAKDALK
jgi:hypothetical protein